MGAETVQYALSAELDTYMQDSIFHMLGFCTFEEQLTKKLSRAKESQRDLAIQLQQMQFRLREVDHRRAKSKEEAVLNAQALKRQVAENQKLIEQCRALKDECSRLEHECNLYHNDRDVFMEAAYEAEDRAAEADDRAMEAEAKNANLIAELDQMRLAMSEEDKRKNLEIEYLAELAAMKSRIAELEGQNASLREAISNSAFENSTSLSLDIPEVVREADAAHVAGINEQFEETRRELRSLQETYASEADARRDERVVHAMVSAAVTMGILRGLEEEKEEKIQQLNLENAARIRSLELELSASRERFKLAEKNVHHLLQELKAVSKEAAICRNNLDKAEVEVQMLADENKEVRILLRRRYAGLDPPMQNKGNNVGGSSKPRGRLRPKPYEVVIGDDTICEMCKALRQPLMPLQPNAVDRKVTRRQYPAVDGNFCIRSPSSPSLDVSPGSKFQD